MLRLCPGRPSSIDDIFVFDQRGLDAVLALCLFELQSGLQYKDKVLPYLIDVLKGIPTARWLSPRGMMHAPKTPMPADFAFCFVSLMRALASQDNNVHDTVMKLNLEVLQDLVDQCSAFRDLKHLQKGEKIDLNVSQLNNSIYHGCHVMPWIEKYVILTGQVS